MGLKSVEIQGFKSFKNKIKLNFDNPITAVVGPNGSGKSNISDAILWVLGEQSAKNLRGNKMQDIIFSGTEKEKPVNFAQVSITFENDLWENIEYGEITVTRRVFRTGESEYYINKSKVRLKDVKELFLNTGIGKEGYSVIGQGKIDEILSSKSEDRRELFEEAAGISKQKYIKEQSVRKLEQTNENLLRIEDILTSQKDRLSYLKKESTKAKRGLLLEENLKSMEIQKALCDINKLTLGLDDIVDKKNQNDESLEIYNNRLQESNDEKNKIEEFISNTEIKLDSSNSKLNEIKNQQTKTNSSIELNNERLKNSNSELDRLQFENKSIKIELENLKDKTKYQIEQVNVSKEKIKELDENLEKFDTESVEKLITEKKELFKNLSDKLEDLKETKTKYIIEKNSRDAIAKEKIKENDKIRLEKSELEQRLNLLSKEIEDMNLSKNKLEDSLKSYTIEKNSIQDTLKSDSKELSDIKEKLSRLKEDSNNFKNRYLFLKNTIDNHEGYNNSVQNFFRRLNPELSKKVIGTLGDLITVDSKYEKSVDAIMASSLQNIIVENEDDAKVLIEFLKKNKIGRLTFLPLSKIKAKRVGYVSDKLVLGHLNQFIKSDEKYREIIDYFAQKTLVTENLDDAVIVSNKYKNFRIVTLDADIINNWGSMVGGFKKTSNYSILSLKNELSKFSENYKNCSEESNKLQEKYNFISNKLVEKQNNLKNLESQLLELSSKSSQINSDVKEKEIEVRFLKSKIEDYNLKLNIDNSSSSESELDIKYLDDSIADLTSKSKELSIEIEELNSKYNSNKMEFISVKSDRLSVQRDLNIYTNQLNENNSRIDYIKKTYAQNEEKIIHLLKTIDEIKKIKSDIKGQCVDYDDEILKLSENISSMKSKLSEKKLELSKYEKIIYDLNSNIQKAEINNNYLIEKALNTTEKLNNLKFYINDLYDINIDMHTLDSNISVSQKEINRLSNELKNIGTFSVDSIKEYENVKKEFDFMEKNKDDLIKSRQDILNAINKLNKEMKELFNSKFKEINEKFVVIFQQLFNGGYANLKLTDDDVLNSGIEIIAQPPGKKLQSLSLLSGGEKSLTAVALLFAIFETRPSSFCILDEIDAALDEINIKRYKEYLLKFKEKTNFIIITHRKSTMEIADVLYGVSMEKDGISKLIKLDLDRREIC